MALLLGCGVISAVAASNADTAADTLRLEVKLIWGTNDATSPDPNHKRLDSALTKWLAKKYQWKNYFEVSVKTVSLPLNSNVKVVMSQNCTLEVKNVGNSRFEVSLIGKGKKVTRMVHTLPKNDRLVIAGDGENETAWFIAFKRLQ